MDYYTDLKSKIKEYLRFGSNGNQTVADIGRIFYSIDLPDNINAMQVPMIEVKLAKLHAMASFELSMALCSFNLAQEMYNNAYNTEMENIKNSLKEKNVREPGADKLKDMILANLDERFTMQKLYADNAVTVMKQVIEHLDFIGWRLKNIVIAQSIDARLEKGIL